jgi:hypothetical protein
MINTTQSKLKTITLFMVIFMVIPAISFSNEDQTKPKSPINVIQYSCKDIMKLDENTRVLAVTFLHGYNLGKKGTTKFNRAKLSDASYKFVDYCMDHPKEKALSAIGMIVK